MLLIPSIIDGKEIDGPGPDDGDGQRRRPLPGGREHCCVHKPAEDTSLTRLGNKVRSGQVFINTYGAAGGVELPFGG